MAEIEIKDLGEDRPRRKRFTFLVDGAPSLYYGSTLTAVERVVNRLRAGRSGEAWGSVHGAAVAGRPVSPGDGGRARIVQVGEVTVEEVETKSGGKKPRERRPGLVIELDGKAYDGGTDPARARTDAAIAAFMTRGRLGVQDEARAAFRDEKGKDCKIHLFDGKLVAKDQDGWLWWVGVDLRAPLTRKYRFKPVMKDVQVKLGPEVGRPPLRAKEG